MSIENTTQDTGSVESAADKIESLMTEVSEPKKRPAKQETAPDVEESASQPEDDTAQDGDPASGPEDEPQEEDEPVVEEPEEDEQPAIVDPPSSWNADDRAKFRELPQEMQVLISSREKEREQAINHRMRELAEHRQQAAQAVQAEQAKIAQAEQQYAHTLNLLLNETFPELVQIENTNWVELAHTDRDEYTRRHALKEHLQRRVGFLRNEMAQAAQHAEQTQQQQAMQQRSQIIEHQYEQLCEQEPVFRDPVKAKAIAIDMANTLAKYGISPEEVGSVADARVVRVMARLAELEKKEATRQSAQNKKQQPSAPRMMQPNAAPTRDGNNQRKVQEQRATLRRSGNIRDAAKLLETMIQ